jgi:hypothetical protein
MEFDPTIIKCPKCNEILNLFFQKEKAGFSTAAAVDQESRNKLNEVIKSMAQVARELEDKEARLARIEDFLQTPQQPQQLR